MKPDRLRRLRRLAAVPRWNGVYTLRQQNTAEHTFQVLVISGWLVEYHVGMEYEGMQRDLLIYAMEHDEGEAVYGDHPSPSKAITGKVLKEFDKRKGYAVPPTEDIRNLVKCADCLDALMFCKEEVALGNQSLDYVYTDIAKKLDAAWNHFRWNGKGGGKPSTPELIFQLWNIVHISNHPVLTELE